MSLNQPKSKSRIGMRKILTVTLALLLCLTFAAPPVYAAGILPWGNASMDQPCVNVTIKNTRAELRWDEIEGADAYQIYRKYGTGGQYRLIVTTTATTFDDIYHNSFSTENERKLFKEKERYYVDPTKNPMVYTVAAVQLDSDGNVTQTSGYKESGFYSLQTPTVLKISVKDKKANITWKTVANAKQYDLFYGNVKNGGVTWAKVTTVTAGSGQTQSASIPASSNYYTVQARDGDIVSARDGSLYVGTRNHRKSRILFLGDSLTYGEPYPKTIGYSASYPTRVAQNTGAYVYNAGIGGATVGIRKGSYSIYRDETLNLASGKTPNKPQSSPMPEAKYSLQDYDIIVIEGGANDYSRGVSLGSFGNMDTSTFYGAYSTMMQTIRKASQKRIADGKKPIKVVCTGMFFSDKNYTDPVHPVSKYKRKNSKGFTYQDYENAIVKEAKEWNKSKYLSVYLYDPKDYSYLTEENSSMNTVDNLHMKAWTYCKIGDSITNFLRNEVWK